jgi:DNA-binding CsgD family transcriptional regulator
MVTAEMARIEDLVRTVLKDQPANIEREANVSPEATAEEIIFDLEVDGSRYLLIRLPKAAQIPVQLSPREREIVRLVALGHSNKIIADVLNISSWTVSTHLRRIFAKLGVCSRAAMVAHFTEMGRAGVERGNSRKGDLLDNRVPEHAASPTAVSRGNNLRRLCV